MITVKKSNAAFKAFLKKTILKKVIEMLKLSDGKCTSYLVYNPKKYDFEITTKRPPFYLCTVSPIWRKERNVPLHLGSDFLSADDEALLKVAKRITNKVLKDNAEYFKKVFGGETWQS